MRLEIRVPLEGGSCIRLSVSYMLMIYLTANITIIFDILFAHSPKNEKKNLFLQKNESI